MRSRAIPASQFLRRLCFSHTEPLRQDRQFAVVAGIAAVRCRQLLRPVVQRREFSSDTKRATDRFVAKPLELLGVTLWTRRRVRPHDLTRCHCAFGEFQVCTDGLAKLSGYNREGNAVSLGLGGLEHVPDF